MKAFRTFKIFKCRLCNNRMLNKVYNFGNFFVSDFVKKKNISKGIKAPLDLIYCKKCKLLQLGYSAPQEIMYKRHYWYRSGVTNSMKFALRDIYNSIVKMKILKKNDVVLDIGANDGTLLNFFKKKYITIGVEPAKNLINSLKKNCHYAINDFWSFNSFNKIKLKHKLKRPKLITAIGMFYDLENPSVFIKDAYDALDEQGIFVAQLMCLKSMLEKNDLGNICHEHLEFYTFASLKYLFEKNGFKILKLEENEINGGSFRIFCSKTKKKSILFYENTSLQRIKKFIRDVNITKNKFLDFYNKEKNKGKTFMIYGASTKGNTVLQYYGLDSNKIKYASERSPEKWGKYTIGTGIKIISEKEARKFNPDYFLVFPYSFINEFRKREVQWLKKGGKFIILYPKFKIIYN